MVCQRTPRRLPIDPPACIIPGDDEIRDGFIRRLEANHVSSNQIAVEEICILRVASPVTLENTPSDVSYNCALRDIFTVTLTDNGEPRAKRTQGTVAQLRHKFIRVWFEVVTQPDRPVCKIVAACPVAVYIRLEPGIFHICIQVAATQHSG